MNKNLKKTIITTLVIGALANTNIFPVFANDARKEVIEPIVEKKIVQETELINAPAKYEYTSRVRNLNKSQLWNLKKYADKANSQNNTASRVSLASYLLGLGGLNKRLGWLGVPSAGLGSLAYIIESDLDDYGTLSYAFTQYRYLDTHKKVKTVKTKIKYKRFFDGMKMSTWYPYSKPSRV